MWALIEANGKRMGEVDWVSTRGGDMMVRADGELAYEITRVRVEKLCEKMVKVWVLQDKTGFVRGVHQSCEGAEKAREWAMRKGEADWTVRRIGVRN